MNQETQQEYYKYMSAERCYQALESGKIRFSSPLLFNDPFDILREFAIGQNSNELKVHFRNFIINYVRNDKLPENFDEKFRDSIILLKKIINESGKESRIDEILDRLDLDKTLFSQANKMWKDTLQRLRLLCLSRSYNNIPLWYHYANQYKGAIISFKKFISGSAIKDIIYTSALSGLETTSWFDYLFENKTDVHSFFIEKNKDWSYEEETRVLLLEDLSKPFDGKLYSDYSFSPDYIGSVYLGPYIEPIEREKILSIITHQYKGVKVYDSKINYKIIFTRVL